ncbi:unnamed protein product [Microthlaspi erraticum]|uniref:Uncharacterized protein n=1 Tax=Microthlaspi erraticum TaxID=1685480 RepID=A0A6D2IM65_9BRAS|nr:unnamed protein product [Microthlaspi erraticum]
MSTERESPNLLIFEACTYVSELLINSESLRLLVLAITNVADEYGESSHSGHGGANSSDPPFTTASGRQIQVAKPDLTTTETADYSSRISNSQERRPKP